MKPALASVAWGNEMSAYTHIQLRIFCGCRNIHRGSHRMRRKPRPHYCPHPQDGCRTKHTFNLAVLGLAMLVVKEAQTLRVQSTQF